MPFDSTPGLDSASLHSALGSMMGSHVLIPRPIAGWQCSNLSLPQQIVVLISRICMQVGPSQIQARWWQRPTCQVATCCSLPWERLRTKWYLPSPSTGLFNGSFTIHGDEEPRFADHYMEGRFPNLSHVMEGTLRSAHQGKVAAHYLCCSALSSVSTTCQC